MSTAKRKYAVYRDNNLIAADLPSLGAINKFVRNDALIEHAQGRPASYMITGTSGFKRVGTHIKGRVRWEEAPVSHFSAPAPRLTPRPQHINLLGKPLPAAPSSPI